MISMLAGNAGRGLAAGLVVAIDVFHHAVYASATGAAYELLRNGHR